VRIRSFKLRFTDGHARVVPATDDAGCPFQGPGVDLRGERAEEAFRQAKPLVDALSAFEPGVVVRSLSIDVERGRLLATLLPTTPEADPRPRVVRIEGGGAMSALLPLAQRVADSLVDLARPVLAARGRENQTEDRRDDGGSG